ncbi:MAG: hypothetical protein ABSG19_12375 [Candidatus Aminicenantales bacterium]
MNEEKRRPYLSDRRCGRCLVPFELEERREGGWLFVTYRCPVCGNKNVVSFSPQELQEWALRGARAAANVAGGK